MTSKQSVITSLADFTMFDETVGDIIDDLPPPAVQLLSFANSLPSATPQTAYGSSYDILEKIPLPSSAFSLSPHFIPSLLSPVQRNSSTVLEINGRTGTLKTTLMIATAALFILSFHTHDTGSTGATLSPDDHSENVGHVYYIDNDCKLSATKIKSIADAHAKM